MQFLLNGLVYGSAIALLALAFQMVYLPTRIFFVGLAGIYSLAPFVVLAGLEAGFGLGRAGCAAVLASGGVSLVLGWANHFPLARRQASEGAQLVASLGVYIILVQIVALLWGSDTKSIRSGVDGTIEWSGVVVTQSQWTIAGVSAALIVGTGLFLSRSELGLRLRALADNPVQFGLFGYNVNRYRLLAFGLAGVLASASAVVRAIDVGFNPYVGLNAVLLAVVAVIVGGQGSFVGPVLGGLVLGLVRETVVWNYSARWQEAATFALLAVFLLFRPQGLFGKQRRLEAAF